MGMCLKLSMVAVAGSLTWSSAASASHLRPYDQTLRCATKTVRDVQVVEESPSAVVFRKLKDTGAGVKPTSFACAYRRGALRQSVHRLDDPAHSRRAEGARLAGVFVAFRLADRSPDRTADSSELVLINLVYGGRWSFFPEPDPADTAVDVVAFVVTNTGAAAWLATGYPSGEQGLWRADANWFGEELPRLDGSPHTVEAGSLRLSRDRRRVQWRRRGESVVRSARLR